MTSKPARKNGYPGPCWETIGQAKSPAARRRAHETYSAESSLGVRTIGRSQTSTARMTRIRRARRKTASSGRQLPLLADAVAAAGRFPSFLLRISRDRFDTRWLIPEQSRKRGRASLHGRVVPRTRWRRLGVRRRGWREGPRPVTYIALIARRRSSQAAFRDPATAASSARRLSPA